MIRLSDEDLARIEERNGRRESEDVRRLLAEVRRLRAVEAAARALLPAIVVAHGHWDHPDWNDAGEHVERLRAALGDETPPTAEAPELRAEDLHVEYYRVEGQRVNEPSRGVRITHIPTGEFQDCDSEHSRHASKAKALAALRVRVAERTAEGGNDERR